MELQQRKQPVRLPLLYDGKKPNIIFLTVCTAKRKAILANPKVHELLLQSWAAADHWLVGHYLVMPDHIHLFCSPARAEHADLKAWVKYWKSLVSRRWPNAKEQPIWQIDFWDTQLRSGRSYSAKWVYVQENPIRLNLVENIEEWTFKGKMHNLFWH